MKLGDSEVHIWQVNLDEVQLHLLSADEQVRADRFKFEQHRKRFIAGRSFLRSLLSRYCQADPMALEFEYSSHGKPALKRSRIQFNLAHSQHLALYAVTYDRLVGIDVEAIRPMDDLESLVQRFFLPSEYKAIRADNALFFQYWTCKEAFLKAIGTGISKLKELEIENAQLKTIPVEARSRKWHLQQLSIQDDFAGAIAVEQNCPSLELKSFKSLTGEMQELD
ncbi:4'-phosphopantetheinyl transferase HetI [Leptolyngbya boryana NIES-2135]|jgi:4'-phosphopantetheinyl transferase|uniref:4'-phosphopantetheinyl transferase HetI n=1 Tax=Leptolyngbya boryana NIES-2135 TaxID=1973484 RepID=A0A1Z4JEB9_LEPBY|nr:MULTISPECIES: 4'-phosphopantetheinyl transferase superfamily protein [Leptolyngbya]BAY55086.1 4'-phosphopantetheinyl transferase HetI [Leptolyngbya boryana NIES-2135]MBD2366066.1 4'-phosphopantetheinyl transferase superfamily protein [Leptolyngbya sp. FACHB-161]MBD2372246.1 4'-phosphopantetheinyl transferase superfamily protein [Leptolyngbya sp. FACHB-238]MBD2396669.1 4'-phosphopantetheinyl transferase superfamily protein [Leptolyngbya sp. FACHB-239]MBD2403192.1 4'-phosphopantetheinyl trans